MSTPYPQQPAGQPAQPVKRRVSYKLAGVLSGIGALLAVSPFLAGFVIELIPGDHGDGGDGLYWFPVGMIFYVLPHPHRCRPRRRYRLSSDELFVEELIPSDDRPRAATELNCAPGLCFIPGAE